jgi:hypothetical protein
MSNNFLFCNIKEEEEEKIDGFMLILLLPFWALVSRLAGWLAGWLAS